MTETPATIAVRPKPRTMQELHEQRSFDAADRFWRTLGRKIRASGVRIADGYDRHRPR